MCCRLSHAPHARCLPADYFTLRRFLRARTYDLTRAKDMWMAHTKWKQENGVDTIMQDFQFPEEADVLRFYPQGYHKMDKTVRGLSLRGMLVCASTLPAMNLYSLQAGLLKALFVSHQGPQ
jgi:hypothetical protein